MCSMCDPGALSVVEVVTCPEASKRAAAPLLRMPPLFSSWMSEFLPIIVIDSGVANDDRRGARFSGRGRGFVVPEPIRAIV